MEDMVDMEYQRLSHRQWLVLQLRFTVAMADMVHTELTEYQKLFHQSPHWVCIVYWTDVFFQFKTSATAQNKITHKIKLSKLVHPYFALPISRYAIIYNEHIVPKRSRSAFINGTRKICVQFFFLATSCL